MNIANITGIVAPIGTFAAAPPVPAGFGALLAIGGKLPVAGRIELPVPVPAATSAPTPAGSTGAGTPLPPMDADGFDPVMDAVPAPAAPHEPPAPPLPDLQRPAAPAVGTGIPSPEAKPESDRPAVPLPPGDLPADAGPAGPAILALPDLDPGPADAEMPQHGTEKEAKTQDTPAIDAPALQTAVIVPPAPATAPVEPARAALPIADDAVAARPRQAIAGLADAAPVGAKAPPDPPAPDGAPAAQDPVSTIAARSPGFSEIYGTYRNARAVSEPVVAAHPGRIGREMGVEIARHVVAGRDEVMVRLDPPEMGRVDIRLSFDRDGSLRGVIAADSPGALDMLRKETADLTRALGDAGIRSDAQSFRFDSRGRDSGHQAQQRPSGEGGRENRALPGDPAAEPPAAYRALRASGRIDLMA